MKNDSLKIQISGVTWTITVVATLIIIGLIGYLAKGEHKHTSKNMYVGPGECTKCHEKQAETWKRTSMAQTFEVLRPGQKVEEKKMVGLDPGLDYTRDEDCLPCHTTGYGLVGGFRSIEDTPEMAGVTCEACHGPGGQYVDSVMSSKDPTFDTGGARDAGLIYPPTARVCRKCHNEDSPFIDMTYAFDYENRVEMGTHGHFQLKYDHDHKNSAAP